MIWRGLAKPNPIWSVFVVVCLTSTLFAQDQKEVIIATGALDIVKVIDPSILETIARIHLKFPNENIGLDRLGTASDRSGFYMEGPIPSEPNGCCALYFVDLKSLSFPVVGSVPGTESRNRFVFADSLVFSALKT